MKLCDRKYEIMDTYYSLLPLNRVLKIPALNCMFRNGRQVQAHWSLIKNVVIVSLFTVINLFVLYYKITYLLSKNVHKVWRFTDTLNLTFILGYALYMVDLILVRIYGTDVCVEYYNTYKGLDKILSMVYYKEIRKIVIKYCVFFILISIISSAFDYTAWYAALTWEIPTLYLVEYVHVFLKNLTILDMVCHVLHVEYCLRTLGDAIQEFETKSEVGNESAKVWISTLVVGNKDGDPKTVTDSNFDLRCFSEYYLMVMKQTDFINKMYGVRILLSCCTMLIDLINILNLIIRVIFQSLLTSKNHFPAISSVVRLLACVSILVTLVHSCERSNRQSERIVGIIDDLLVYKKTDAEVARALKYLRDLILTRPVNFHAANFFRINYPLFVSMVSVVVTYTIIFLQSMK